MEMVKIENLSKRFKGLKAVNNISFEIEEGKISGLIGPNGAGKTTVFNMISGTFRPTEGQIYYKGRNINKLKAFQYTGLGIARTFQFMKPLVNMSVLDNVMSGAFYGRYKCKTIAQAREVSLEILNFTGLYEKRDWFPKDMGTPFKKRLELARAIATKPDLLLLDEVMAGLNPKETDDAVTLVRKINENGTTVFMIEHIMRAVVNLCEKIIVLHHGEKIAEGTPEKVMTDPYVIEIYLGKEDDESDVQS